MKMRFLLQTHPPGAGACVDDPERPFHEPFCDPMAVPGAPYPPCCPCPPPPLLAELWALPSTSPARLTLDKTLPSESITSSSSLLFIIFFVLCCPLFSWAEFSCIELFDDHNVGPDGGIVHTPKPCSYVSVF